MKLTVHYDRHVDEVKAELILDYCNVAQSQAGRKPVHPLLMAHPVDPGRIHLHLVILITDVIKGQDHRPAA